MIMVISPSSLNLQKTSRQPPEGMERSRHLKYLNEFRTSQCPLFLEQQCQNHRPYTCFYWHFPNQRRRRPIKRADGTFNYNPDVYCDKYDENAGTCPDGDACPYAHRNAGDTERRYHPRYFKTGNCIYETTETGACVKNGLHCAFAHGPDDLRLPVYDIREIQDSSSKVTVNLPASLEKERVLSEDPKWNDMRHVMARYKTELCKKPPRMCRQGYSCPYYHNGKDKRRMPDRWHYRSTPCPAVRPGEEWLDSSQCEIGDACTYCHTRTEQQFHPEIYKSTKCNDVLNSGYCPRGPFCAFAHDDTEMAIGRDYLANLQQFPLSPQSTASAGAIVTPVSATLSGQQFLQLRGHRTASGSAAHDLDLISPGGSSAIFSPNSSSSCGQAGAAGNSAARGLHWPPCSTPIFPGMKLGVQSKGRHRSGSSVSSETAGSAVSGTQSGPMAAAAVREGTPPFPAFSTPSGLSPVGLGPYARGGGTVGYFQQLAQHHSQQQRQKNLPEASPISVLPARLGQPTTVTRPCRKLASSVTESKFNSLRVEIGGGSVALENLARHPGQTALTGKMAQARQSPQRLFSSQSAAARLGRSSQQQQQQPPPPPISAWWPILGMPPAPETEQQQPSTSASLLESSRPLQAPEDVSLIGDQQHQHHHQQQGFLASLVPETLRTMLTVNTGNCDGAGAGNGLPSDRELLSGETKMAPLSQFQEDVLSHYRRLHYPQLTSQPPEVSSVGGYLSKRDSGLFDDITDALSGLGGLSDSSEGCYGGFTSPLCSPSLCCAPSSGLAEEIVSTAPAATTTAAAATRTKSNSSAPVNIPGRCLRRVAQRKFDVVAATVPATGLSSTTSGSSTATAASSNTTADTSSDSAFHSATTPAVCGGGGAFVAADAIPSSSSSSLLAAAGVTAADDAASPISEHDSALFLSEGGGRPVKDFRGAGAGLLAHAPGESIDFPASYGHNSGGKLSNQQHHQPTAIGFARCVNSFPAGFREGSPPACGRRQPGGSGSASNVVLSGGGTMGGGGGASASSSTCLSSSFTNLPQSPVLISSPFSNPGCDLERIALRRELEDALSKLKEARKKIDFLTREHMEAIHQLNAAADFIRQLISILSAFITRSRASPSLSQQPTLDVSPNDSSGGVGLWPPTKDTGQNLRGTQDEQQQPQPLSPLDYGTADRREGDLFVRNLLQALLSNPLVHTLLARMDTLYDSGSPLSTVAIGTSKQPPTAGNLFSTSRKSSSNLSGIWSTGGGVLEELEEEESQEHVLINPAPATSLPYFVPSVTDEEYRIFASVVAPYTTGTVLGDSESATGKHSCSTPPPDAGEPFAVDGGRGVGSAAECQEFVAISSSSSADNSTCSSAV